MRSGLTGISGAIGGRVDHIGELFFNLSGGASNLNPALSLGGAMSNTSASEIRSQKITDYVSRTSQLAFFTYVDSIGNALGVGTLTYTAETGRAKWAAAGDTAGAEVFIRVYGRHLLYSGTAGAIIIFVSSTSNIVTTGTYTQSILIEPLKNALFDYISSSEASAGDTEYRCIYLKLVAYSGVSTGAAANTRVWIDTDAVGADSITIGLGSAGINAQEQSVANESTAPSGVTFSAPTSYVTGLVVGDLTPGSYRAIWIKRVIPANTVTTAVDDYFVLNYGCNLV